MRISPSRLAARAKRLDALSSPCRLCPNACGADRRSGSRGRCGAGIQARVASFGPHFGEEDVLVGSGGSGTVFFSGCNLTCIYCQNWSISQERAGAEVSDRELAQIFLEIQHTGCSNLNLVTPTPHAAAIVRALAIAARSGWSIPIVWNCGGYEAVEVLRCLAGVVDLYMPDVKYGDSGVASRLSGIEHYVARSREAAREMQLQVGDLVIDGRGLARAGLLVRHLVLPEGLAGTEHVVRFLAREVSPAAAVHVMGQYRPCFRAEEIPELRRRITRSEYERAVEHAIAAGVRRIE